MNHPASIKMLNREIMRRKIESRLLLPGMFVVYWVKLLNYILSKISLTLNTWRRLLLTGKFIVLQLRLQGKNYLIIDVLIP